MKHTRQDYLDQKCTHADYYGQFVTPAIRHAVKSTIGLDAIRTSKKEAFNDIPLSRWDGFSSPHHQPLFGSVVREMKEAGDFLTLSGIVCVTKEAARQLKAEIA